MWTTALTTDEWVALATGATAVCTLVLAVATFALAWQNRQVVKAAEAQAQASRDDLAVAKEQSQTARAGLAAQTRPFLSSVPFDYREEPHFWQGGNPVAFRDAGAIQFSIRVDRDEGGHETDGKTASIAVPFRNIGPSMAIVRTVAFYFGPHEAVSGYASNPVVPSDETSKARLELRND